VIFTDTICCVSELKTTNQAHSNSINLNDMEAFVAAIHRSRINSLSLAFNSTLRDQFLTSFRCYYPPSRYLRHISLSGVDYTLDELSVPCAALRLLPLARVLMLCTSRPHSPPTPDPYIFPNVIPRCSPQHEGSDASPQQSACMPISHAYSTLLISPLWQSLPVELQLHIFQYVAPSLSFSQIARVVNYAIDITTLFRDDKNIVDWLDMFQCGSS
jgi:hypothetical protein